MAVIAGEVKSTTPHQHWRRVAGWYDGDHPGRGRHGGRDAADGLRDGTEVCADRDHGYDTVQFDDDGLWGDRYGWTTDGTDWYTTLAGTVERWDPATGTRQVLECGFGSASYGVVYHSGHLYTLENVAGIFRVAKWDVVTEGLVSYGIWSHADGTNDPAIGVDSATGELLIAQSRASNVQVRTRRYTMPAVSGDPLTLVGPSSTPTSTTTTTSPASSMVPSTSAEPTATSSPTEQA